MDKVKPELVEESKWNWECPHHCGMVLKKSWLFCPNCGKKLDWRKTNKEN